MMARFGIFATLVVLWPLSYGLTVSEDFATQKRADNLFSLVRDSDVLAAFLAAGHPDAVPLQSWEDENGTTYQKL